MKHLDKYKRQWHDSWGNWKTVFTSIFQSRARRQAAKKIVNIVCGSDTITLHRNKQKSIDVKLNNKSLYYLIFDDNKYKLMSTCAPTSNKNKKDLLTIAEYSTDQSEKVEQNLTVYTANPNEVMMIFSIGYGIKFNIGRLFKGISDEFTIKQVDCD